MHVTSFCLNAAVKVLLIAIFRSNLTKWAKWSWTKFPLFPIPALLRKLEEIKVWARQMHLSLPVICCPQFLHGKRGTRAQLPQAHLTKIKESDPYFSPDYRSGNLRGKKLNRSFKFTVQMMINTISIILPPYFNFHPNHAYELPGPITKANVKTRGHLFEWGKGPLIYDRSELPILFNISKGTS